jgi:outer membrane protein OmpA-like peptidoglycan-associated protein
MLTLTRAAALALLVLPLPLAAQSLPVGFGYALEGDDLILTVEADEAVEDVEMVIRARGGRSWTFSRSALADGARWTETLPAPTATTQYTLELEGSYGGIDGALSYDFAVEIAADLDFEVDEDTFDAEGHAFTLTMNQPADRVELTVRGESGNVIAERVVRFDGEPAGTPLRVTWSQSNERILTVDVRAVSTAGAWFSRQYVPWAVEFDAVHVNFPSGSADIPESDFAMLEARYAEVVATAQRVAEFVEVKLYVAGYTDTVGGASDNQSLSEARARSLGRFFADRGWSLPLFYQGFGESALAVATDDNVDEPANRRAIFILTTQTPPTSANIPRSSWRPLD